MRLGRPKVALILTDDERVRLDSLAHRSRTAPHLARRARIILACAEGHDNKVVAKRLRMSQVTVCKWRGRFIRERLDGLYDEPRPGAPRRISDEQIEQVIVRTLEETPRGATHWSSRGMAKASGLGRTTVQQIWRAFGLQPHRSETFKLSNDPLLIEKVRDIVGLYMNPPAHAVVFCVDEKSQIQALDRTQPLLPMRPGTGRAADARLQTARHDDAVCRAERQDGQAGHGVPSSSSLGRVSAVPRRDRRGGAKEVRRPPDHGQLRDAQNRPDPKLVRETTALPRALHADLRIVAEPGRAVVRRADEQTVATRRAPRVSRNWRRRSASSLTRIMRIRSRSCGPRPLTRFSKTSRGSLNGHSTFRPRHLLCEPRGQDTRVLAGC